MFYINPTMIEALVREKQHRPLVIEDMVVDRPKNNRLLRKRVASMLHQAADALEPRPALELNTI